MTWFQILLASVFVILLLFNSFELFGWNKAISIKKINWKSLVKICVATLTAAGVFFIWESQFKPYNKGKSPSSKYFDEYIFYSPYYSYRKKGITKIYNPDFIGPALVLLGDWEKFEESMYYITLPEKTSPSSLSFGNESIERGIEAGQVLLKLIGIKDDLLDVESNQIEIDELPIIEIENSDNIVFKGGAIYSFNEDGLLSQIGYNDGKEVYKYGQSKKIEQILKYKGDKIERRDSFIYLNELDYQVETFRESDGITHISYVNHFNENGFPISSQRYNRGLKAEDFNLDFVEVYLSSKDYIVKKSIDPGMYGFGNLIEKYDKNFTSVLSEFEDNRYGDMVVSKYEYLYDKKGNWYLAIGEDQSGDLTLLLRRITYKDGKVSGTIDIKDINLEFLTF